MWTDCTGFILKSVTSFLKSSISVPRVFLEGDYLSSSTPRLVVVASTGLSHRSVGGAPHPKLPSNANPT
jgi:hypothetical protein